MPQQVTNFYNEHPVVRSSSLDTCFVDPYVGEHNASSAMPASAAGVSAHTADECKPQLNSSSLVPLRFLTESRSESASLLLLSTPFP